MSKRVPASMRTRQSLTDLIEGRLSSPDGRAELAKLATRLFTFLRYPPEQWKSLRMTNAIERLHEEFKRRIKNQCTLPSADTAAMLFWALVASAQINMRRVDGWQTLVRAPANQALDHAA